MFRPLIGKYKGVTIVVMATVLKYRNCKYQYKIKHTAKNDVQKYTWKISEYARFN